MNLDFAISADSVEKLEKVSRILEKIGCERIGDRTIGDGAVLCRSFVAPNIIDDDIESAESTLTQAWQENAELEVDVAGGAFGASVKGAKFPILSKLQPPGVDRRPTSSLDAGKRVG